MNGKVISMSCVYLLVTMNEYGNQLYYFLHGEIKELSIKEINKLVVKNSMKGVYDKFSYNKNLKKVIEECLRYISKIIDKGKLLYLSNFYLYVLKIPISKEEKIVFCENDQKQNLKIGFINKNLLLQRRKVTFDQTNELTPSLFYENKTYFIVKNTSFYGKIKVKNLSTNVENIYTCKNNDIYVDKNFIILEILFA